MELKSYTVGMEAELKKAIKDTLDSYIAYYRIRGGTDKRVEEIYAEALQLLDKSTNLKELEEMVRQCAIASIELLKFKFKSIISKEFPNS